MGIDDQPMPRRSPESERRGYQRRPAEGNKTAPREPLRLTLLGGFSLWQGGQEIAIGASGCAAWP